MRPRHAAAVATARGFTLVELAIVCALAGVLLALAWPSLRPSLAKAGRGDAVHALTQLQQAQARYHALHGLYAHDLRALGMAASGISPQGLYTLVLEEVAGDGFTASAQARPGSPQAADRDCARLTVHVKRGFANLGPSTRCWQP